MTSALLPLHTQPSDVLLPLTPARLLSGWQLDWPVVVILVLAAAAYVYGVRVLRRRGDRWSAGRTASFLVGGLGTGAVATLSALGRYDTVLISVHMAQHMILSMATPMFLALGAPVTLALRTLPPRPRGVLLWLLHTRLAKVLTFAPLTLALFVATPFALYFSGWYPATLRSAYLHDATHLHFVLVGAMFFWPLVGVDPVPGKVAYPLRVLLLFLSLPFHAFLGVSIMGATRLIAEDWYVSFGRTWGPSPAQDQYLAGGILWGSGDIVALTVMVVLFVQWFRQSQAEARREDRRLDRLDRLAAADLRAMARDRESSGSDVPPQPETVQRSASGVDSMHSHER